jgi:D-alanine-D-alanine ligase
MLMAVTGLDSSKIADSNTSNFLGPVCDLEKYVHPDWWRYIFNANYLKTDGDIVDDLSITRREVDLFAQSAGLLKSHKILDLCCGQGRHLLELKRRGYDHVEGLDRSRYLVSKARSQARKEGISIRVKEGDARKLPYPADSFDVVMILGNSFGYFESVQDDEKVLKEVLRVLKPMGKLLIDISDGDYTKSNFQKRSWEWIDKNQFVCRERSLSSDQERLITREVMIHVSKGVIADHFYAERLYSTNTIERLLQSAGFSSFTHCAFILSETERNQDLGMMERRIVSTSFAPKEWTVVNVKQNTKSNLIAVLLGDPSKTDDLKPDGVFDQDDLDTIDLMKSALKKLSGREFVFLDKHDELIDDLRKLKSKIKYILNFCDEGYFNNPRYELHVPALAEMLNIPYSGSGSQCLAYCYDKSLVRGVAKEMGIEVPEAFLIKPQDRIFDITFDFPVIVKPNFGDSSFGITEKSVANNIEELINAVSRIRDIYGYDKPILVEEFLAGKDLSIGIIGNPPNDYIIFPIIQEDYSSLPEGLPRICGYEAKWLPESPYFQLKSIPADLPYEVEKSVTDDCLKLFERLECRDYCRFDLRLDKFGKPKLLEVNPNPGWVWDGHLAKMAELSGVSYSEMLGMIIKAAESRIEIQN